MKAKQGQLLLINFNTTKTVVRAIIFAQAVAILIALAPGLVEDRWYRLGLSTLLTQWITLITLAILYILARNGLLNRSFGYIGFVSLTTLQLSTYFVSHLGYWFLEQNGTNLHSSLLQFIILNMLISLIVGVMGIEFFIVHNERNESIKAQARAELDALQARIQPHFLFNSLNSVAELTNEDPKAAEQALLNLSNLFRASLNAGNESNLQSELELIESYLSLESWRLGNRLRVTRDIPDALPDIPLPSLTLQPLIENAVRHGIEPNSVFGNIHIEVKISKKHFRLIITNPIPINPSNKRNGNGIAINNIRQRLALIYNKSAQLTTRQQNGVYHVELVIPLKELSKCAH